MSYFAISHVEKFHIAAFFCFKGSALYIRMAERAHFAPSQPRFYASSNRFTILSVSSVQNRKTPQVTELREKRKPAALSSAFEVDKPPSRVREFFFYKTERMDPYKRYA